MNKGYTLIELLIVVVTIFVFGALVIGSIGYYVYDHNRDMPNNAPPAIPHSSFHKNSQ